MNSYVEVCFMNFSAFPLIPLSCLIKMKKNALLYSKLSNNTLLLLSTHPLYFTPHTSEAILSTHCHTSTGSVRYLYVPLLFLNPPAVSLLWLSTDMPHSDGLYRIQTISLCCPQKGKSGTQRSLYLYRIHAELSFVCKTPLSIHLNASSHSLPPTKSASFIL